MISALIALPLCLSLTPLAISQEAGGLPVDDAALEAAAEVSARMHAVLHDSDLGLRDMLVRNEEVWHDAGEFLVGVFSAHTIQPIGLHFTENPV